MTRSRRPSLPRRLALAILAAASLLLVAPVLVEETRGLAAGSVSKEDLFVESVSSSIEVLPAAVGAGEVFQGDLLEANGGWVGDEMPWSASGTFAIAEGAVEAPHTDRRIIPVLVRTEIGIPVDASTFADQVMTILNDPRGWGPIDGVSFARTDLDAEADIVITLASPGTTEILCGELPTHGYTSCGRGRPVNINGDRWVEGAPPFLEAGGTLEDYRVYLVNHEVGHSLSHPHEACPGPGEIAPTMLQQTLTVGECIPNGWPNPSE